MRAATTLVSLILTLTATAQTALLYPETEKVAQTDTYHGTAIADPYRWLEDDVRQSEDVRRWVEAQNEVTFRYLQSLPGRDAIRERLTKVWDYERYSIPVKEGGRYFFRRNDGLQNQSVLYVSDSFAGTPRPLIDPNTWSKDGTVALGSYAPSEDGRYVVYSRADKGSDWTTLSVMEVESGRVLEDELLWIKFDLAAWTHDHRGFFYSRFPQPPPGAAYQAVNRGHKLYYHRLGTAQSEDVLVQWDSQHPERRYYPRVTDDGRYLVITMSVTTHPRYRVLVRDLREPYGMAAPLVGNFDYEYNFIANDGPIFYFLTDRDAPRGRLIAIDMRSPEEERWKVVIPESAETLVSASLVGNRLIATYLKDARSVVKVFSLDGQPVAEVQLATLGDVSGFEGRPGDPETFYAFQSFTVAPSIYRYDVATGKSTIVLRSEVGFDPSRYEVKQVFYSSKDGTRVPMFICHRRGLRLNGSNPTLLYGYGGFNISQRPVFSPSKLVWMEMGGVFALANLRGGGEYGAEWHAAGTKLKKQNVFDDFIAAAEYLITNRYTRPQKLAIQGGSNGGLLVGAAMTQRPELFGVALPAVGVMDMLRFHRFTAGAAWVDDYGSPENPEEFRALAAYSPYHNLKKGTKYPATLVTTADHDDRVVPGHSFKFAAALQEVQGGAAPVLIRITTSAGHGAGKPTRLVIEQIADQYAFAAANLGMKVR